MQKRGVFIGGFARPPRRVLPLPTVGRLGSGNNLPIFSGMSERALRAEPTVTVECLSCRHVGVLTGAALSRLAIMPDTPIAHIRVQSDCIRRLHAQSPAGSHLVPSMPDNAARGKIRFRKS